MDCSQASRGDVIGLIARPSFESAIFRGALASQLLSDPRYADAGALIVVCWHHGNIPSMAHALRAKLGSYPDPWDADVFNQILVLSYLDDREPKIDSLIEPF
jgi:hypothetical protein